MGSGVTSIENERVRVEFNPTAGTFDLIDLTSRQPFIQGGRARVESWCSDETHCLRATKVSDISDELGKGRRLTVTCAWSNGPALIAEFTLHGAQDSAVVLRAGLDNRTGAPLRIKEFHPLADGVILPGAEWTDVRSLNGDSACAQARVTRDCFLSSANNLLLTFKQGGRRHSVVLGGLKTMEFTKWASSRPRDGNSSARNLPPLADLKGSDPVGKRIEAGAVYLPEDSFYVDCGTPDPFAALEKYGQRLSQATLARPHPYDFPTVCAWYAGVWHTPGAQNHPDKSRYRLNTTAGLVEEIEKVRELGFLRYSRVACRLVPDTYESLNPQGWWDDDHWRLGGYYVAPYDTSQTYGKAMHERGGLAFTYFQPTCAGGSLISKDFRDRHRDWLCAKSIGRTLDYTHPAAREYLRKAFAAMRGGIDGLMVDYCDDLWSQEASLGGFTDAFATSTSFYRAFFELAKEGLGANSWLHERNLNQPNNDLTLGLVDLQRISWDTDKISPDMVSRGGLRWYKNRVVYNYDMDSKDLTNSWKVEGFNGSDQDGRRMMLTMEYVAASRLLLASSFRDLPPEAIYDLSRTLPYPAERRSARPVDAFVCDGWPRVYDFAIDSRWRQVTLYNNALPTREELFSVPLSGEAADGALGLDALKEYYVYDFWNNRFAGRFKGADRLTQTLRPGEARMLSVHEVEPNPQFISTSRHIMQGYLDLERRPVWNPRKQILTGASRVVAGEPYEVVLALNGYRPVKASANNASAETGILSGDGLLILRLASETNTTAQWKVTFERNR
jgi:hypothetical protein